MQRRYWIVLCALGIFLLQCGSYALADDHSWGRGGGSGGAPLDASELAMVSFLYTGVFVACFAALLFLHVWLVGLAVKLGWFFALLAPLSGGLFFVGAGAPVGFWIFTVLIEEGFSTMREEAFFLLLSMCLLTSLLYHYALCVVLGLFSPRAWGGMILRLYGVVLCGAVVLALVKGSLIVLLLFLALCLVPHWIAWKIYIGRNRSLKERQTPVSG